MPRPSLSVAAHGLLVWVVREFLIIVALSSISLLAIIQIIQYQVRILLIEAVTPPCKEPRASCVPLARLSLQLDALSPLDVLTITALSTILVFSGIETARRMLLSMGWLPDSTAADDVEACSMVLPGEEVRIDWKATPTRRPDGIWV
ncbi:hypothetical protein K438DRAFT_2015280 [Mycena galopus ATCC 62051]|nr:hypothetical protein K438DRAFT_2015280 [Mycena galopus ATCC 62051]